MFCPYTPGGELARKLRKVDTDVEKLTGYKIKIIEEAGEKVMDILHSSNPWRGKDCGGTNCWLCMTKEMTGKQKTQDYMKRSLVYKTWGETCLRKVKETIEDL